MKRKISKFIFYFILFFSFLILNSSTWLKNTFGLLNLDSLIFHINVPLKGTSSSMITSFIFNPLLKSILLLIFCIIIFNYKYVYKIFINIKFFKFNIKDLDLFKYISKIKIFLVFIFLLLVILLTCQKFGVIEYYKNLNIESKFIEENYVEPENTLVEFPDKKRNLIYILLESMEYTYADKENGGAYEENYIPNLTKYAKEEISFKNDFGGGFYNTRATGWTIAGMVAQSAGIGFLIPGDGNEYGNYSKFLPGAYSLGEILEKNGYNQTLLIGSDANFAGRKDYYVQHGNYQIKDYDYAIKQGWIDEDYNVWWGYEDSKLFEFAKLELEELSNKKEPFNLTLLTTNTHHIGGYLEDGCEIKYEEKLKNVVACSDKQVYEFVQWAKEQDFYENTTIVITGDHLSMEPTFFNDLEGYERTNYNVFINSYNDTLYTNNRLFTSLDIYPTIIGSLGGNILGNRLALGTNLFTNTKTLYEKYSKDYVDKEFSKTSNYFRKHLIFGN